MIGNGLNNIEFKDSLIFYSSRFNELKNLLKKRLFSSEIKFNSNGFLELLTTNKNYTNILNELGKDFKFDLNNLKNNDLSKLYVFVLFIVLRNLNNIIEKEKLNQINFKSRDKKEFEIIEKLSIAIKEYFAIVNLIDLNNNSNSSSNSNNIIIYNKNEVNKKSEKINNDRVINKFNNIEDFKNKNEIFKRIYNLIYFKNKKIEILDFIKKYSLNIGLALTILLGYTGCGNTQWTNRIETGELQSKETKINSINTNNISNINNNNINSNINSSNGNINNNSNIKTGYIRKNKEMIGGNDENIYYSKIKERRILNDYQNFFSGFYKAYDTVEIPLSSHIKAIISNKNLDLNKKIDELEKTKKLAQSGDYAILVKNIIDTSKMLSKFDYDSNQIIINYLYDLNLILSQLNNKLNSTLDENINEIIYSNSNSKENFNILKKLYNEVLINDDINLKFMFYNFISKTSNDLNHYLNYFNSNNIDLVNLLNEYLNKNNGINSMNNLIENFNSYLLLHFNPIKDLMFVKGYLKDFLEIFNRENNQTQFIYFLELYKKIEKSYLNNLKSIDIFELFDLLNSEIKDNSEWKDYILLNEFLTNKKFTASEYLIYIRLLHNHSRFAYTIKYLVKNLNLNSKISNNIYDVILANLEKVAISNGKFNLELAEKVAKTLDLFSNILGFDLIEFYLDKPKKMNEIFEIINMSDVDKFQKSFITFKNKNKDVFNKINKIINENIVYFVNHQIKANEIKNSFNNFTDKELESVIYLIKLYFFNIEGLLSSNLSPDIQSVVFNDEFFGSQLIQDNWIENDGLLSNLTINEQKIILSKFINDTNQTYSEENIQDAEKIINNYIDKIKDENIFRDRDVLGIFNNEFMYNNSGNGYRFGNDATINSISSVSLNFNYVRNSDDNNFNSKIDLISQIEQILNKYKNKITIYFDGHGNNDIFDFDNHNGFLDINTLDLAKILLNKERTGYSLNNIIIILNQCNSFIFAETLLRELDSLGAKSYPIIITASEYGQVGFSSYDNKYNNYLFGKLFDAENIKNLYYPEYYTRKEYSNQSILTRIINFSVKNKNSNNSSNKFSFNIKLY